MTDATRERDGITANYFETEAHRVLTFDRDGAVATIQQNREGYAMVTVRRGKRGEELERYYGFDMALDHAAELLDVDSNALPVPEDAQDMGM